MPSWLNDFKFPLQVPDPTLQPDLGGSEAIACESVEEENVTAHPFPAIGVQVQCNIQL